MARSKEEMKKGDREIPKDELTHAGSCEWRPLEGCLWKLQKLSWKKEPVWGHSTRREPWHSLPYHLPQPQRTSGVTGSSMQKGGQREQSNQPSFSHQRPNWDKSWRSTSFKLVESGVYCQTEPDFFFFFKNQKDFENCGNMKEWSCFLSACLSGVSLLMTWSEIEKEATGAHFSGWPLPLGVLLFVSLQAEQSIYLAVREGRHSQSLQNTR